MSLSPQADRYTIAKEEATEVQSPRGKGKFQRGAIEKSWKRQLVIQASESTEKF